MDNICEINSMSNSQSIINNKKWMYGDNVWSIDYSFTVHNVLDTSGEAGVLKYHFNTICDLLLYWNKHYK